MDGSSPNALRSPIEAGPSSTGCYAIRQPSTTAGSTSTTGLSVSGVPSQPVAVVGATAGQGQHSSLSPRRRARLQRSERLQSDNSQSSHSPSYSSWEALIRDSFGQIVWPIRITSWEVVQSDQRMHAAGLMPGGRNASYHVPDYVAASISSRVCFVRAHVLENIILSSLRSTGRLAGRFA
ncbi:hypothetical protein ZHAS_00021105 [Anopheles sinensis]|uniref:Uncharacterized protein n=1 Tax=Anopheles sinensis TaxID=74873 RepID=A0A084WRJ1_ANOSI|nr:hypothetical protein ZHAS_00021105 [Anopheles sinensis]